MLRGALAAGLACLALGALASPLRGLDVILPPAVASGVFNPIWIAPLVGVGSAVYLTALLAGLALRRLTRPVAEVALAFVLLALCVWALGVQATTSVVLLDLDQVSRTTLHERVVFRANTDDMPTPFTPSSRDGLWDGVLALHEMRRWGYYYPAGDNRYSTAYAEHAQALLGAGEIDRAAEFSAYLTRIDPQSVLSRLIQAKVLYRQGKVSEAIKEAKSAERAAGLAPWASGAEGPGRRQVGAFVDYYSAADAASDSSFDVAHARLLSYARAALDPSTPSRVAADSAFSSFVRSPEYGRLVEDINRMYEKESTTTPTP